MNKSTRRGFIYFRYILPIITPIISLVLMLVPCYRYATANEGLRQPISAWTLIGNAWDTVREYLFGNAEKMQVTSDFAGTVLGMIMLFAVLFVIGFGFSVYTAVTAFRFFSDGCSESRAKILFITLVPNRAVLCIYSALTLPLLFIPRIMPLLYNSILNYHTELICQPFDMIIVHLVIFAITVATVFVSAAFERREGINLFARYKEEDVEDEPDEVEAQDEEDAYTAVDRRAREEQNERILRLLGQSRNDDEEK